LTLQITQLLGVLCDRYLGPVNLSRQALLFFCQSGSIDARRLRGFLGALGFCRQPVQLPGGLGSLTLGSPKGYSQTLTTGVLIELLTQLSGPLFGSLERGARPFRRLAGRPQPNSETLGALRFIQLLSQLFAGAANLVQVLGNPPSFGG